MKAERFCVLFVLCCINFAYQVDALKVGEGVCTVKSSVRKTKIRIVTQTKNTLCGKKKCVVKIPKRVTYLATVLRTVCCNGWEYLSDKDVCIPQCSTGCLGGRCTAPNVCVCDPPMYLDPEHRNNCIKPTCDPPCVNAECTFNNTCNCLKNFTSFNATHCLHCEAGYSIDTTFKCKPQCTKGCENGTCTAPDVCTCLPGFSKQEVNQDCKPVCEKCVNASCIGPNVCSCWEGYNQINDTHCSPKCDDCDGICVGPNICECSVGYKKINDSCTPICNETCQNAVCIAPNVCSCFDGYLKKKDNALECYKPCKANCTGMCNTVDECIEKNCYFTYPTSKLNKYGKRVKHISTVPHCCTGWNYDAETDGCKPAVPCNGLCVNSKCGDNDVCECNSGHRRVNETHCAPECSTHFVNDPYTLKCICEHGYKWSANETKCLPVCEEECENGECVAPNECTCHPGYEFQSKYKCKPVCSICENGECISPNVCVCSEGYTRKGSKCIPVCEEECVNGFCIVPNICECGEGYRNNLTAPHICYKPCNNICNYGNCDLHGRCICDAGFKFDGDSCKLIKTDEVNKLSELSSNKTLASLQLSWILAGVVILLLVTLGVVIMQRIWQKTKKIDRKPSGEYIGQPSIVYTVPNTLTRGHSNCSYKDDTEWNDMDNMSTLKCDTISNYENVEDEAQEQLFKNSTHL